MGCKQCQPLTAADPLKSWLVALLGTPVVANSHGTTAAKLPRLFVLGKSTLLGRQGLFMPCPPRHLHPGGAQAVLSLLPGHSSSHSAHPGGTRQPPGGSHGPLWLVLAGQGCEQPAQP